MPVRDAHARASRWRSARLETALALIPVLLIALIAMHVLGTVGATAIGDAGPIASSDIAHASALGDDEDPRPEPHQRAHDEDPRPEPHQRAHDEACEVVAPSVVSGGCSSPPSECVACIERYLPVSERPAVPALPRPPSLYELSISRT